MRKNEIFHTTSRIERDCPLDLERKTSCWKSCIRGRVTRRFDGFAVVGYGNGLLITLTNWLPWLPA